MTEHETYVVRIDIELNSGGSVSDDEHDAWLNVDDNFQEFLKDALVDLRKDSEAKLNELIQERISADLSGFVTVSLVHPG